MGNRLKVERVRRGLTQVQIVALISNQIDQPRLSQLERGKAPRKGEAKILEDALGISPGELWPELGEA